MLLVYHRAMLRTPRLLAIVLAALLAGCASFLPTGGPSTRDVVEGATAEPDLGIRVVDVTGQLVRRVLAARRAQTLAETFGEAATPQNPTGTPVPRFTIGNGDVVEISLWEAPPAALFGAPQDPRGVSSSRTAVLPEQVVDGDGTVNVPFAGTVKALGRTPQELEREIVRRLKSKAHDPQVMVRVLRNTSSMVTVVGEVTTSARVPLTPKGERLLDALAAAGGFRQPVGKITIRVTREVNEQGRRFVRVVSLPLETVITDPAQNIVLQPGDVITALYQSNSFSVLGATSRNEEVNFEAQGISLSQALARAGGLNDYRANATAVFIFRFEDPAVFGDALPPPKTTTVDGRVPIVYRMDLKDPASFFIAQDFPMRNKDVMYVANAPATELQKFVNLIAGIVLPVLTLNPSR
jgi:polysaccharide export outer membrane protein